MSYIVKDLFVPISEYATVPKGSTLFEAVLALEKAQEEFEHSVATTDLHVLAILKKVAFLDNYQSSRKGQDQKEWVEPNMTQIYIGYYDGSIRFIDQESCGIQVFSRDELKEELTQHPEMFTEDIKYIMKKFAKLIKPITKINKVLND